MGLGVGCNSEKSRSERLVTPVLLELCECNNRSFSIYSGMNLDVDPALGLRGECNFIFSFSRIQDFITAPIFCIAEAKKQYLELGTLQCAAQLIAARRLNEYEGNPAPLRLLHDRDRMAFPKIRRSRVHEFILDENRYYLAQLPALLGALQTIADITQIWVSGKPNYWEWGGPFCAG